MTHCLWVIFTRHWTFWVAVEVMLSWSFESFWFSAIKRVHEFRRARCTKSKYDKIEKNFRKFQIVLTTSLQRLNIVFSLSGLFDVSISDGLDKKSASFGEFSKSSNIPRSSLFMNHRIFLRKFILLICQNRRKVSKKYRKVLKVQTLTISTVSTFCHRWTLQEDDCWKFKVLDISFPEKCRIFSCRVQLNKGLNFEYLFYLFRTSVQLVLTVLNARF